MSSISSAAWAAAESAASYAYDFQLLKRGLTALISPDFARFRTSKRPETPDL